MAEKNITNDIELSQQEELAAAHLAGTLMGKLCFGGAKLFKGVGLGLELTTHATASGLHAVANGIDKAGRVSSGFCYAQGEKLEAKQKEYEADTQAVAGAQQELIDAINKLKAQGVTIEAEPA
jgi:hypothetical protein